MKFIISGKNITVTEGLKTAVQDKLSKLERYFTPDTEVIVALSAQKDQQKIEVTIPVKGNIIRSEQVSNDMYVSIDLVEEVIERQLRKYKNKIVDKQQAAANFQRNIQTNKYTQAQAQQIQAGIQKQAADAEALQQRLGAEYQKEVTNYNKALSDSVHNYLKSFNKDKKYVMILAKSGDNILYADDACNITSEVVKGMNKAYTGMKK